MQNLIINEAEREVAGDDELKQQLLQILLIKALN
jgi:hypothetical protein